LQGLLLQGLLLQGLLLQGLLLRIRLLRLLLQGLLLQGRRSFRNDTRFFARRTNRLLPFQFAGDVNGLRTIWTHKVDSGHEKPPIH